MESALLALQDDALGGCHARLAVHNVLARAPKRLLVPAATARFARARGALGGPSALHRRPLPHRAAVALRAALQIARRARRRDRRRVALPHRVQRTGRRTRCRR